MKRHFLFIMLLCILTIQASAQKGITYTVDVNDPISIRQNLKALSKSETDYWVNTFKLDSAMTSKLQNNNFSIYMQYIEIMKHFNYKMEKVLLVEQYNFKNRRRRFMKMFLSERDFKTYEAIILRNAENEIKKYKDEVDMERRQMRVQAAGWNVLGHTINFK